MKFIECVFGDNKKIVNLNYVTSIEVREVCTGSREKGKHVWTVVYRMMNGSEIYHGKYDNKDDAHNALLLLTDYIIGMFGATILFSGDIR